MDHLDLDVQRGELFVFLGPNGAGKTTTIRMLTCQLEPSSGTATEQTATTQPSKPAVDG